LLLDDAPDVFSCKAAVVEDKLVDGHAYRPLVRAHFHDPLPFGLRRELLNLADLLTAHVEDPLACRLGKEDIVPPALLKRGGAHLHAGAAVVEDQVRIAAPVHGEVEASVARHTRDLGTPVKEIDPTRGGVDDAVRLEPERDGPLRGLMDWAVKLHPAPILEVVCRAATSDAGDKPGPRAIDTGHLAHAAAARLITQAAIEAEVVHERVGEERACGRWSDGGCRRRRGGRRIARLGRRCCQWRNRCWRNGLCPERCGR